MSTTKPPAGGGGSPRRSNHPALTDWQKIEITRRHYVSGTSQTDLAERYQVSEATISRAVKEVVRRGWVTVSITESYGPPASPVPALADKLQQRYPAAENVYVLKSPQSPLMQTDPGMWSDHVHHVLGWYLGSQHVRKSMSGYPRIGVSSGRGVYYTIRGIVTDWIRTEEVTVLSLTGSFENRAHGRHEPAIMDGDTNAATLALGFARMVQLQTVGSKVVVAQSDKRPPWFDDPPSGALVGVGVLEPTNRLLQKSSTLEPLRQKLDDLQKWVSEDTNGHYIPCADMCNCLIWIPPPRGLTVKYEREIRSLIEIINGHLCVIPFKQLRRVRGCWIAAGTPKKAAALHHCLTSDLRINALCVDSELAEELLKLS